MFDRTHDKRSASWLSGNDSPAALKADSAASLATDNPTSASLASTWSWAVPAAWRSVNSPASVPCRVSFMYVLYMAWAIAQG